MGLLWGRRSAGIASCCRLDRALSWSRRSRHMCLLQQPRCIRKTTAMAYHEHDTGNGEQQRRSGLEYRNLDPLREQRRPSPWTA